MTTRLTTTTVKPRLQ